MNEAEGFRLRDVLGDHHVIHPGVDDEMGYGDIDAELNLITEQLCANQSPLIRMAFRRNLIMLMRNYPKQMVDLYKHDRPKHDETRQEMRDLEPLLGSYFGQADARALFRKLYQSSRRVGGIPADRFASAWNHEEIEAHWGIKPMNKRN